MFSTYHPKGTLSIKFGALHLCEKSLSTIPFLARHGTADLHHLADSVGLQQLLVVKVVEQDVNALVHVVNLGLEGLWCHSLDAGDFR